MRTITHRPVWFVALFGALACSAGKDESGSDEPRFEHVALVSHPGGYGGAPASADSTCARLSHRDAFEVDWVSRELSWDVCHFDPPNVYTQRTGTRMLTEEELDSVEQLLESVDASKTEGMCGADAGFRTLDVRTEAGTALYISATGCPADSSAGRTPAGGISDVALGLSEMSGE